MDNNELKMALGLKDKFAKSRFSEKKDLTLLRHKLAMELIEVKDKVATKRHSERIDVLKRRLF